MREAKCYLELRYYKEAAKANENAKINFRRVKDTLEQNKIGCAYYCYKWLSI